jgi:hypothetical protein
MTCTEIISLKEPPAVAGLAAKLPAVFLPGESAAERFLGFRNHFMRAKGITDYLKSNGSLAKREMANDANPRTTQLYDRRAKLASLDEYGKVGI